MFAFEAGYLVEASLICDVKNLLDGAAAKIVSRGNPPPQFDGIDELGGGSGSLRRHDGPRVCEEAH
jgi:hypothetical protein